MSNSSKGKRFEKRIRKYLESIGYITDQARASVKFIGPGRYFSSANDFFNCADLIGIHPSRKTLLVQCTYNTHQWDRRKKMEKIPWNLYAQDIQVWVYMEKGPVVKAYKMIDPTTWNEYIFRLKDGEMALSLVK